MGIGIFHRPYTIRRRGEQKVVNGYAVSGNSEFTARLNIQPLSADELLALPEGERSIARVKSFGTAALISADEYSQTLGDLLYYDGRWYECKSCVHWLHTPLTHYEAEFVILADQSKQKPLKAGGDTP
jgi:hypothetical protein